MALANTYNDAIAVTPSDTININTNTPKPDTTDALWVGGAGIVAAVLQNNAVVNLTATAGSLIPIRVKRVNSTTTTATLIVALYMD